MSAVHDMACAVATPQAQMPPHSAADGTTAATAEMAFWGCCSNCNATVNSSREAELERLLGLALEFDRGYFAAGGFREGPLRGRNIPSQYLLQDRVQKNRSRSNALGFRTQWACCLSAVPYFKSCSHFADTIR